MRRKSLKCILITMVLLRIVTYICAAEFVRETAIVWLVDVSGSMANVDKQSYWADAISLGMDLAPENARVAFIAVSDTVVAQTQFASSSISSNRISHMAKIQNIKPQGNTDFNVGIAAAMEMLESLPDMDKNIFFVADIDESGFVNSRGVYTGVEDIIKEHTAQMRDSGIKAHLLFMSSPRINTEFMPFWEEMANETGGSLTYIENPAELTQTVEKIYFNEFTYNASLSTVINTAGVRQDIPVRLPAFGLDRARIYLSTSRPISGIQLRADDAQLSYTETRSYTMFDLTGQIPGDVTLTLPPVENAEIKIRVLAKGGMTISSLANNEAEKISEDSKYRQKTTVTLTPDTNISGTPGADFNAQIMITDPLGQKKSAGNIKYADNAFTFEFYPQDFGKYIFSLLLDSQGIRLSSETDIDIGRIDLPEPPVLPEPPKPDYILWLAILIGLLLILAAILIAISRRKRDRRSVPIRTPLAAPAKAKKSRSPATIDASALSHVPLPAAKRRRKRKKKTQPAGSSAAVQVIAPLSEPEQTVYALAGKLDIYGILVDGGRTEIPATSARLEMFGMAVTLDRVMEHAGIPYHYPASTQISMQPHSENALEIHNNSDAVIYCGGQPRYRGQQATLYYGQKLRVVFESEVSEYDIFYHASAQIAISSNHIRVEAAK